MLDASVNAASRMAARVAWPFWSERKLGLRRGSVVGVDTAGGWARPEGVPDFETNDRSILQKSPANARDLWRLF
jgi:hypothetical protein